MNKMKVFSTMMVSLLLGCCIMPYGGRKVNFDPFDLKVKINVDTSKTNFSETIGRGGIISAFSSQIVRAIETDLEDNLFPNIVENGEDFLINIEILDVHVNAWGAGKAQVTLKIMTPDETPIKIYSERGSCGMRFTILEGAMDAVGDAIQKIKCAINEDRDEITKAIVNKK
jgi:hypothetical protein